MNPICVGLALLFSSFFAFASPTAQADPKPSLFPRPKLVVLLVIDQFRADYLQRFESRFLPPTSKNGNVGGFRYLMNQGAYFPMAEYGILQSMTCPGHATLLTGAYPYQAGIPLNGWADPKTGQFIYCAEDTSHKTVGAAAVDHVGTSPKNLIATTVGDELKNAGFPSRVVSIALKDRSAIMMGGHRADLAIWMDSKSRNWVSSTYYLKDDKLPPWVQELNHEMIMRQADKIEWKAEGKGVGLSDESYHPTNANLKFEKSFPHESWIAAPTALAFPYGLELTESAAEKAFNTYRLGRGPAPDLLAVSFSSHDYVGHAFSPNSREMEEITIHEDRVISKLLNHLRKSLPGGLKDVVLVLTADHGVPPDPTWAKANGIDAGKLSDKTIAEELEKVLSDKFGAPTAPEKWIWYNHDLNIYVNRKTLAARKADLAEVLNAIKTHTQAIHGIAHVFTLFDYQNRKLPPLQFEERILRTYFPGISGDVVLIPRPYFMIDDYDTVAHQTAYSYDRMVPLIMAGSRIRAGVYPQYARIIDLAPTLSFFLGVLPPSLSEGRVLNEVVK